MGKNINAKTALKKTNFFKWSYWLLLLLFLGGTYRASSQTTHKPIVLQAFWWDYWNSNYENSWANYLTELAPRLKSLGIDAVWIPPSYKNGSPGSVGYSPFDHYDLGEKYQKNYTTTRVGTKDELLRMIAVMHANGIEVIQDIVLNHVDAAGTDGGAGGQDPEPTYSMQTANGYKNFRYTCWETPYPENGISNETDYWARKGRWPKNYPNFHPHSGHNSTSGDWEASYWGPDLCFGYLQDGTGNGYGQSSNATTYNPAQYYDYNRTEARNWILWFSKQTAVDGFRWDAVKHYPYFVQQDLSWNLKYNNASWANLGEKMFNVGEYVGGKTDLDNFVNNVTSSNGGSDFLMGTFDFGLREGFYSIITGNGSYDIGNIPNLQQNQRVQYYSLSNTYVHRTVGFVNNHDTFRPQLSSGGNYTGWNTGNELAPHIDPYDARLPVVYATMLALDGSPQIFFEDLFDIGANDNRWTHDPTNSSELPVRAKLENILWCHQNLDFKSGAYRVRWQAGDLLIIERSAKAVIAVTDNWNTWQDVWIDTDFAPGTRLKDYSGNHGSDVHIVQADKKVNIKAPKVEGYGGYAIWAPEGISTWYNPPRSTTTTQEWEMANDLGDRHCNSLGQGGALPANSTTERIAGKIFVASGTTINYRLWPENNSYSINLSLFDLNGNLLSNQAGTGELLGSYSVSSDMWIVLKVRNSVNTNPSQKVWVRASYQAPAVVNTSSALPNHTASVWLGLDNTDCADCGNWETGKLPDALTDVIIPSTSDLNDVEILSNAGTKNLSIEAGKTVYLYPGKSLHVYGNLVNNGTLVLMSDANGYATLLNDGTLSGSGTIKVMRHLPAGDYHYISSPIINPLRNLIDQNGSNTRFYEYDETYVASTSENWLENWKAPIGTMTAAKGYALGITETQTIEFNGTAFNTGNISISVSNSNKTQISDGWNLVGNPYPSAINAELLLTHNATAIDGSIYLWENGIYNNEYTSSDYATWNLSGYVGTSASGKNPNGYIAASQAFFVHRSNTAPASENLEFTNTMRAFDVSNQFYKSTYKPDTIETIRMSISNAKSYNEMLLAFHQLATSNHDQFYDAYKIAGNSDISLYAIQNEQKYAILSYQNIERFESSQSIKIGYSALSSGEYTFKSKSILLPENYKVWLIDRARSQSIELKDSIYQFYTDAGIFETRFEIIIGKSTSAPSSTSIAKNIYFNGFEIVIPPISEKSEKIELQIFDLSGRIVLYKSFDASSAQFIPANIKTGIYQVLLQNGNYFITKKIFVEK